MTPKPVTLHELNSIIKGVVNSNIDAYWVSAEINELKVNHSGHCYLELIQKDSDSERIVARVRAIIWEQTFRMIQPYFESTTGQQFTNGINIMVKAKPEFHELYGLSLNIFDIEPTYTVGELVIRKQKIIKKLEEEGVINMNKEIELPLLVQRIAVISSKTAAGLGDFHDQLLNNPLGFAFYPTLFSAVMQGNEAESSIINALDKIYQNEDEFDAVVIIRGGGSQTDLECFNSYWLAYHIAQFPLPVFTGIGHEQDDSIADLVAHTRLKTPTAVAEYLISLLEEQNSYLSHASRTLSDIINSESLKLHQYISNFSKRLDQKTREYIYEANSFLHRAVPELSAAVTNAVHVANSNLQKRIFILQNVINRELKTAEFKNNQLELSLVKNYKAYIRNHQHYLDELNIKINASDPELILKKGYTITTKEGRIVKSEGELANEEIIETLFIDGKVKSKIQKNEQ